MDLSVANIFNDFWNDQLVENDQQALFMVIVGFLGSFIFIRISTRLMRSERFAWWPGSIVSEGGVHLHHLVFGIVTMMLAGTLGFAFFQYSPIFELSALAFGIGVGLTIDEFALWVHLDDVYWAEEGRRSIDATVVACLVLLLLIFGVRPFEVTTADTAALIASIMVALFIIVVVGICFLKERILHGVVGFFIWPVALYGAWRIGKPNSPWGKRRYGEKNPEKQALAEVRFSPERRTERFKEKFRDVVGGGISQH
ncbi:MAG: hypothetical protein ACSLFI_00725 [Solirubrobacterales bacterium]